MAAHGSKRLPRGLADAREKLFVALNQGKFACGCGCVGLIEIKPQHIDEGIPAFIHGHHAFEHGRIRDAQGYIRVSAPNHPHAYGSSKWPRCQYVFEHRLVAEQKIGRLLRTGEIVHHINGIKDDNRPENLEVLTEKQHFEKHYPDGRTGRHLTNGHRAW